MTPVGQMAAEGSGVQGKAQLHMEFEANMGYRRHCQKTQSSIQGMARWRTG